MRIKLEGKNEIEQYVYALTHELKSPLAAIRGAAEILREGPPADVVTRFTENILAQNTRMQALVETLLRRARLENRQDILSRRLLLMSYLRSLTRRAVFSWRQKYHPYSTAFLAGCRRRRGASGAGAGQCVGQCHRLYA